ncbi:hypothetical protein GCM10010124_00020 [Pilimelia terevasa]|uniref:Transposase n=1 Tax=Pilimelia terevasa TaxID=53372 RepID=A0A8J3BCB2_9ACTN|nr:hypothetical protein GCM10010124_00020 [Pilimelia terevasa]
MSWQASKTWKASNDPDFTAKMRRVLDLYDRPPAGGRVICADEFGPLNLQPRPGRGWRKTGRPLRLRATYTRDQGVRHMIAALDLATGRIHYRIRYHCGPIEAMLPDSPWGPDQAVKADIFTAGLLHRRKVRRRVPRSGSCG